MRKWVKKGQIRYKYGLYSTVRRGGTRGISSVEHGGWLGNIFGRSRREAGKYLQ